MAKQLYVGEKVYTLNVYTNTITQAVISRFLNSEVAVVRFDANEPCYSQRPYPYEDAKHVSQCARTREELMARLNFAEAR